jgi:GalNAc5-diNAcBac-PP-undecaprenol beta-1,3-glucosyltransferase
MGLTWLSLWRPVLDVGGNRTDLELTRFRYRVASAARSRGSQPSRADADDEGVLVSLVIPTYNRAHLVGRAIASVLRQTYKKIDVVVVDDGSRDSTDSVVRGFGDQRIRMVRHAVNRGVNAAKNTGLENVRGEWISILDSDDELLDDAIETLMKKIGELAPMVNVGTVMGNCRQVPGGGLSGSGLGEDRFVSYDDFLGGRVQGEFWGLFSRKLLGSRRFDERLRGFESLLWFELYKTSQTYYLHRPLRLYHRGQADSLSNFENILRSAPQVLLGYEQLLAQRGAEMQMRYPKRYAHYLRRKALFEIATGKRLRAVATALTALRFDSNSFEGLAVTASVALPRSSVIRLLRLRSSLQRSAFAHGG